MQSIPKIQSHLKITFLLNLENEDNFLPWIEILLPGPQTTVQDLGRPEFGKFGVSKSGAADPGAVKMANFLLGNEVSHEIHFVKQRKKLKFSHLCPKSSQ